MKKIGLEIVVMIGLGVIGAVACSGPVGDPSTPESAALSSGAGTGGLATVSFLDGSGVFATTSTNGESILGDLRNPFFQSLGTNGRACATCHRPGDGFGLRTDTVQALFAATWGLDPLFRLVDGANTPNVDVSTLAARRQAYSLLLNRGTFRISQGLPANAQFTVESIQDPYGFATADNLSLYRKPLPATNLTFAAAVMWDGREPTLASQANDAALGHEQAPTGLTTAQQQSIVAFESSLFTAQTRVAGIGSLVDAGGGPVALSQLMFAFNANAPAAPPQPPLTRNVFTLFGEWASDASADAGDTSEQDQQAVLRGQTFFNTRTFGKNPLGFPQTCSFCHGGQNVGNNDHLGTDGAAFQATGTSGQAPLAFPNSQQFLAADLPVYTLKNTVTGATVQNNDPGRALVTGLWNDIGRFKTPDLRGLAARAPYFHNGMAAGLMDVVNFYNTAKAIPSGVPFTDQEKSDLVAFLSTL